MVTYKLSSQFAPRARGLPFVQQHRRVPGSAAAASVRLSLSGCTRLDGTGKLSLSGPSDVDTMEKLSLSGPSDADKTGEEMLPRCRNGDDCQQRRPKLRLTGRDGPPGIYRKKITGGSACPVPPAVVWFATQQPATAGTRIDLSASAGPARLCHSGGPENVGMEDKVGMEQPDKVGKAEKQDLSTSGINHPEATEWGRVCPFYNVFYRFNADSAEIKKY